MTNVSSADGVLTLAIRSERFEMKALQNGQQEFTVTDDEKKDILTFDTAGDITLINGKTLHQTVAVTTVDHQIAPDLTAGTNVIEPRNSETDFVTSCPYGSSSDYSDYQYRKTYAQMWFEEQIYKYTVAALAGILSECSAWPIA